MRNTDIGKILVSNGFKYLRHDKASKDSFARTYYINGEFCFDFSIPKLLVYNGEPCKMIDFNLSRNEVSIKTAEIYSNKENEVIEFISECKNYIRSYKINSILGDG